MVDGGEAGPPLRTQRGAHEIQVLVDAVALDGGDDVVVQEVGAQVLDVHRGRADLQVAVTRTVSKQ